MKKSTILLILFLFASAIAIAGCGGTYWTETYYYYPDWTPDGKIICVKEVTTFQKIGVGLQTSSKYYITTMSEEGTQEADIKQISRIGKVAASPLGNYVAYANGDLIQIITNMGTAVRSINCGIEIDSFDWSSTEARIVYATKNNYSNWGTYERGGELIVVNIDGTSPLVLDHGLDPSWRKNADIVYTDAYYVNDEWGWYPRKISIINSDGANKTSLVAGRDPQVTDENRIVYRGSSTSEESTYDSIKSIKYDGSDERVNIYERDLWNIRLSPNGRKILGTGVGSGDDLGKEIWIINFDGTGLKRLK